MTSNDRIVLALDAHGGDRGLDVSVPAACDALSSDPDLRLVLVGDAAALRLALAGAEGRWGDRLQVHHADSVIPMDAKPSAVLRHGKGSSLWEAFGLVAAGTADGCVSGGNTAAMMLLGMKLLGRLPGIDRPALMAYAPNPSGYTGLLDLGANLSVEAHNLAQFAVMGAVTAETVEGIGGPRVGLLNVGHEDSKGHRTVQEAQAMLRDTPLNYVGFIEGHDIFSGRVDVAVCDGFSGNLVLKSGEGLARMMLDTFRKAFERDAASRLGAWLARRSLRQTLAHFDPATHNGAPLLGLDGVAIKSHGSADRHALARAIVEGGREARRRVHRKIEHSIREYQLETTA